MSEPSPRPRASHQLLVELARALHEAGAPAHRIEDACTAVARAVGVERAAFFSTPTSLMTCFAPGDTTLLRVQPSDMDLSRLDALDTLAGDVVEGALTAEEACERIEQARARPRPYGPAATPLAFALASFAVARSFGGGLDEMLAAGGTAGVLGLVASRMARFPVGSRAFELFAALFAGVMANALAIATGSVSAGTVVLAGLIVLFPGHSFTLAVSELSTRNLVSGASRLTFAALTLLQLGIGAALAERASVALFGDLVAIAPTTLPAWTEPIAVAVAGVGLSVLFQVPRRTIPWVLLACLIAFTGARVGAGALGPELGVGLGALAVTAGSNLWARRVRRSPLLPLIPAIVLLVPGSVGYRSMEALVHQQTVAGIEFAVSMVLIAVSIVAGMTLGNAIVSPRRPV